VDDHVGVLGRRFLSGDVVHRQQCQLAAEDLLVAGERVPIINHANSLDGGHKPDYDATDDGDDVFIRSVYFKDPNGTTLEFACWTKALDETDVRHAPATARTPVDA
jgi:hypothetical protein